MPSSQVMSAVRGRLARGGRRRRRFHGGDASQPPC